MITGITLENFKCFRKVEIHPKRITCFVGANGTGKSSVLQAFGLLKQTVEEAEEIPEGVTLTLNLPLTLKGPLVDVTSPKALTAEFGQGEPKLSFYGDDGEPPGTDYSFSYFAQLSQDRLVPNDIDSIDDVYMVLKSLKIVPAIRGLVHPVYKLGNTLVEDVSLMDGVSQQEEQTATNLGYSQSPTGKISGMLKRVTGVGLRADTVPPQSVEVKSLTPSGPVNIVSEGFGANSLIMLLLQMVSADKGATVMIEEPEIHLHPKAQAELASVLAEVALEEDKQVIMTTHSEHITGRLLTLVAEGTLSPDDLAIYSFEKDPKTGECSAKSLGITDDGRIQGSIADFFEANLEEMNRFVKAQFARVNQTE